METDTFQNSKIPIKEELGDTLYTCRVCMNRCSEMRNIFDHMEKENIVEEIQFCTGVHMNKEDGLPSNICNTCLYNLSIACNFKNSCLRSDETFRKLIKDNIKSELPAISQENDDTEVQVKDELCHENYEQFENYEQLKNTENCHKIDSVGIKNEFECTVEVKVTEIRSLDKTIATKKRNKLKRKKLYCEPCGLNFTTKALSDKHKRDVHNEPWMCEICGKQFTHRSSHYAHIRSHLPPNYTCEQCGYKTWHKSDLIKHLRIHTGIKIYQCELCSLSYHTSSNLRGHIRRYHEAQKPHSCTECDTKFFDRHKLNRHLDSHNKIKRFECDVCHSSFSRRYHWKKHLLQQHDVVVPPQRPGRRKVNLIIGEHLMNSSSNIPKR